MRATTDTRLASIGIFDSGLGGLTVLRAIKALMPYENIIYCCDTAHLPYGNKTPEDIVRYTLHFVDFLIKKNVKALVIACNTACAYALDIIKKECNFPILGILQSGIDEVKENVFSSFAILATTATLASRIHNVLLPDKNLTLISCPLFVSIVEEGYIDHPLTKSAAEEYLHPLREKPVDAALLACSHYPFLHKVIQKELGPEVALLDPSARLARQLQKLLISTNLLNSQQLTPTYEFFVSDDPEKFRLLGQALLNFPIKKIKGIKSTEA